MEISSQEIYELIFKNKQDLTQSQKEKLIKVAFSDPKRLVRYIWDWHHQHSQAQEMQVDFKLIYKMYEGIDRLKCNNIIGECYTSNAEKLEDHQALQAFVNKKQHLVYFFVVLSWEFLYFDQNKRLTLLKYLNIIKAIKGASQILHEWLNVFSSNQCVIVITKLQQFLIQEFEKLLPVLVEEKYLKIIVLNIENICHFLELVYKSNKKHQRVPIQIFNIKSMNEKFDPLSQIKLHLSKQSTLNFIRFPFLLDFDYKYKLLQYESVIEQEVNRRKNMEHGLQGLMQGFMQLDLNGNFSIEGLLFLYFQVNRQNILDDSMEKLSQVKQSLKSPLRISFIGEEGADEGGVKNEYFQLVVKEIFNPLLDMFMGKGNNRYHWFNGYSFEPPIRFEFVGMLLGLAIYNQVHLNIRFPFVVYKMLLIKHQEINITLIQDLKEIQPDLHRSLKQILDITKEEDAEALELFFNIELESFGEKVVEELVPDGNKIKLTKDNKEQYCILYADYILNKHIYKQFQAFRKGFFRVVSGDIIFLFDPFELRRIICGNENIDFKELQQNTKYEHYDSHDSTIKMFWKIVHEYSLEEKKELLIFLTGSDRVPIQGMKSLNFIIQKHSNTKMLPTAHTCFNVLELPPYESEEKMRKNLKLCLANNQGFGLL